MKLVIDVKNEQEANMVLDAVVLLEDMARQNWERVDGPKEAMEFYSNIVAQLRSQIK